MKRHSPFNLFIVGLATAAITVLPMPWVQRQISTRYLVLLLEVALGLPCLVVLAVRQPVAVRDPVAVGATPPGAQSRKKHAAAPAAAPAPALADPGRTQLAARLALGFLAVAVVAALLSDRIGLSIFGQRDWANGALLTIAIAAMWALGVGLGEDAADLLEQCLVAAVLVNAGIAVIQGATGFGLAEDRAPGLLDNPVYLAPLLVGGLWLVVRRLPTNLVGWGAAIVLLAAAVQTVRLALGAVGPARGTSRYGTTPAEADRRHHRAVPRRRPGRRWSGSEVGRGQHERYITHHQFDQRRHTDLSCRGVVDGDPCDP